VITIEWKRNTKRLSDFNLVEIYKYLVELWVFEVGNDAWSNRARARSVHETVGTSKRTKYLGFIISIDRIEVDPKKTAVIN
jgi:hypothetical protein